MSNASPLIALAKINCFYLLKDIFNKIAVPATVWHEVVIAGAGKPGANEVIAAQDVGWLYTDRIKDSFAAASLRGHLGAGEAEAIVLARELSARWLLLDDGRARATAKSIGLNVKGTVGLLIAGYHANLLSDLKVALNNLRATGFWISDRLYQRALSGT